MKRRTMRRREVPGTARYLTFTCQRRLPLFRPDAIKDLFIDRLTHTVRSLSIDLLAWVVMPDHVHLIVYSENGAVSMTRFTHALKRPFALEVLNRWRTLNAAILTRLMHGDGHRFWQTGGGFDRNVFGDELIEKIRYVHGNPVRRGLSERAVDYRWSSAAAYAGAACTGPDIRFDLLPKAKIEVT